MTVLSPSSPNALVPPAPKLPPALATFIRRFVLRTRRLAVLQACGAGLAFVLIWTLLWALVDRLHPLPVWFRCALLAIDIAAFITLLARPLRAAIQSSVPWQRAAAAIEARDPRLGGALQTAVSQSLLPEPQRGSSVLIEQIVAQTTLAVAAIDAGALVSIRAALRPAMIAASALLLMLIMLSSPWLNLPRLLERQWLPFAGAAPVTTTRLFISPGATQVIEGEALNIFVRAERLGDSQPLLQWRGEDPVFSSALMSPEPGGYGYRFDAVNRPMSYRVRGGDATSPLFPVGVIPRPTIKQVTVSYTYPSWSELAPTKPTDLKPELQGPVGTVASITLAASEKIGRLTAWIGKTRVDSVPSVDPAVRVLQIPIQSSGNWKMEFDSVAGIKGIAPSGLTLRAIAPTPPTVKLLLPDRDSELRLQPRDTLSLAYRASDVFALVAIHAEVTVNATPVATVPIPLGNNHRLQEGSFEIDFARLGVRLGDVINIVLVAKNTAGLTQQSDPCRIVVSPQSIDLNAEQRLGDLRQCARLAKALDGEVSSAHEALRQSPPGDAREARDAQVGPHLAAADAITADLSRNLLRALAHSSGREFSIALMGLLDTNQRTATELESANTAVLTEMRGAVAGRLDRLDGMSAMLSQVLDTLWRGELAEHLLAEVADAQSADDRVAALPTTQATVIRHSADRARADERAGCAELGINDDLPEAMQKLQSLASEAAAAQMRFNPINFAAVAEEWSREAPDGRSGLVGRLTVASQAEAIRPEGDFVWARDLSLAARAARRIDTSADIPASARGEYPSAIRPLQQLTQLHAHRVMPEQLARAMKAADDARRRLRLWAGEEQATTRPDTLASADPQRAALEAAAAVAQQQLEREARLQAPQHDSAADQPPPIEPAASNAGQPDHPPPQYPQTPSDPGVATAQQIQKLEAQQQTLRRQTARAHADSLMALAQQQQSLTQAIRQARQTVRQEQDQQEPDSQPEQQRPPAPLAPPAPDPSHLTPSPNVEHPKAPQNAESETSQPPEEPSDSREAAINTIRAQQEKLLELPHEIDAARAAAQQQTQAEAAAKEKREAADSAEEPDREQAERAAADAQAAADAAHKAAQQSTVSPDESGRAAEALKPYAPETTAAVEALEQKLTPALTAMRQAQANGDDAANAQAAQQAKAAVADVQRALDQGLQTLLKGDALTAAKFFSQQAAGELEKAQPDRAAAMRLQRGAAAALEQAWDQELHRAQGQSMARLPSMASVLHMYPAEEPGVSSVSAITEPSAAQRDWGKLRERKTDDLSVGTHEIDPPEYQDALRVYFSDLSHAGTGDEH
jgi:hypothetical protein